MKNVIRDIFPGGNTPLGFYSYYNYILPQRKAQKIFCIKGGPGVGKSTLMKELADVFIGRGENVDIFRCSSDPDSLDGILLRNRNVAVVDGTSPHIIDPVNPGAVDEIVDLGRFLDTDGLKQEKDKIISCGEMISGMFTAAYGYLKRASVLYEHIGEMLDNTVCSYNDCINKTVMSYAGQGTGKGEKRKFFAGAITPDGIKSCIKSLCGNIDNIFVVNASVGAATGRILEGISDSLACSGFDVEEFYCPMKPDGKPEHIVSEAAGIAVFTVNEYHGTELFKENRTVIFDDSEAEKSMKGFSRDMYNKMKMQIRGDIEDAVSMLREAKEMHDVLESYYIRNIDFKRIKKVKREIIAKIE